MEFYEFEDFQFDTKARILLRKGTAVPLTPKASDLLAVFLQNSSQVLLKEELLSQVWPNSSVEERNLNLTVHYLRKALGQRNDGQPFLENIPKRGYRFTAPVRRVSRPPLSPSIPIELPEIPPEPQLTPTAEPSVRQTKPPLLLNRWTGLAPLSVFSLLAIAVGVFALRVRPAPELKIKATSQLTENGRDKGGLLTDGVRIYFPEQEPEGSRLASVAVEGGATGVLPISLQDTAVFDLSPLRSEILVSRYHTAGPEGDLWVLPFLGGSPRRLGDLKARAARWSPGHTRIASIRGTALYISSADGADAREVATIPQGAFWLRWSPDEEILRFSTNEYRNGDTQFFLWQINADGSSLHPLLSGWNNPPAECCGSWTPDGKFYVFESVRNGHNGLFAIAEHRSVFGNLSSSPVQISPDLLDFYRPTISLDGSRVFALGRQSHGELVRFDSKLNDFVKFLDGVSGSWVTFSKSGHSIAYIDYPNHTIWRANADGSQKSQITFAPFQADGLSWSPDENWLAARARTPGHSWRVYLIPLHGGEPQQLTPGQQEQGNPSWSSDGKRLCFGDVPAQFENPSGTEAIHIFDLHTHALSDLPGSSGLWTCRWSPNGRYISALTIRGQKLQILDLSAGIWRSTAASEVNTPNWSADSKFIYYDTEPHDRHLRRFSLTDGRVTELTDLRGYQNLGSWWTGLTPDNSLMILRDLSTFEVYSLTLESR
jgi:Tol biopolymer transport system component/DNA-binding winged helix-turn-helix (wHTH) protein